MIQERNNKITLDAQILEIREQIRLGNQTFPIDIVETIGNDSQLYYELPNGYWERYDYDGDGSLISYTDSNDVKVQNETSPDFDLMLDEIMVRIMDTQILAALTNSYIGKIAKPVDPFEQFMIQFLSNEEELMIKEAKQDEEALEIGKLKPMKVYLVEQNDVDSFDNTPYQQCHDNFFIKEAIRQGNVYTIKAYQNHINAGEISMTSKLIRFI